MNISQDSRMPAAIAQVLSEVATALMCGLSRDADARAVRGADLRAAVVNVVVVCLLEALERGDTAAGDELTGLGVDPKAPLPFYRSQRLPAPFVHTSRWNALFLATMSVRGLVDFVERDAPGMTADHRIQRALELVADRLGVAAPDLSVLNAVPSAERRASEMDQLATAYGAFARFYGRKADICDGEDFARVVALLPVPDKERLTGDLQLKVVEQTILEMEKGGKVESRLGNDGERLYRLVRD